jgi:hypothetical protein
MVTASVMVGSCRVGVMCCRWGLAMLNSMVSLPGWALAPMIAARMVQNWTLQTPKLGSPSAGSPVLLTSKVCPAAWADLGTSIMLALMSTASSRPKARAFTCPNGLCVFSWTFP